MSIPGHFAAAYLTTRLTISSLIDKFPQIDGYQFWAVGMLASLLVDLDELYAFHKANKPILGLKEYSHRRFITHAPFLHFGIGLLGFVLGLVFHQQNWQLYSVLYVVGTWTHFFFDSFSYGIMWLWPLNSKVYAFFHRLVEYEIHAKNVFDYYAKFLIRYLKDPVFIFEMMVVTFALLVKFKIF